MDQRVIVVTGAFGVLGSAVARAFAQAGDQVAQIDRSPSPAKPGHDAALVLGGVDLSDPVAAQQAVEQVLKRHGRIDVLVNIAGAFAWETLAEGNVQTWDRMYTINLKTAVCACQAALPALIESGRGRIINIGAGAAAKAGAGMGAYAAAKAGVARLTEALAEELKDAGVTVNAVLPSVIDTPQNRRDMPDADFARWVRPEAIASVIQYLASDAASAVTGASIAVPNRV